MIRAPMNHLHRTTTLLLSLLIVHGAYCQIPDWGKDMGAGGSDLASSLTTDVAGNVYITGFINGVVDLDPSGPEGTVGTAGVESFVLAKYLEDGEFAWGFAVPGARGNSITSDPAGRLYVTGCFDASRDFDPSSASTVLTAVNGMDAFIACYGSGGDLRWAHGINADLRDTGTCISTAGGNAIYCTIHAAHEAAPGSALILRYDADGLETWRMSIPSRGATGWDVEAQLEGGFFVSGVLDGRSDLDPLFPPALPLGSDGDREFLARYQANGQLDWSLDLGAERNVTINALAYRGGRIHMVGSFALTPWDVDPRGAHHTLTPTRSSSPDAFLVRYSREGNFQQAFSLSGRRTGTGSGSVFKDIAVDGAGNVYVTGAFEGICDPDPSLSTTFELTCNGRQDYFLAKYGADGGLIWVDAAGGAGIEHGTSVAVSRGGIHVCGWNESREVEFGELPDHVVNLSSAGSFDILMLHYPLESIGDDRAGSRKWIPIPKPYLIGAALLLVVIGFVVVRARARAKDRSTREA